MAMEETFRHEFQIRVEDVLDAESARFLMAHLPPVPWPEVATKADLTNMEIRTDARFSVSEERVERRLDAVEGNLERRSTSLESKLSSGLADQRADLTLLISNQTRTMIIALIMAFVAISSLALFR